MPEVKSNQEKPHVLYARCNAAKDRSRQAERPVGCGGLPSLKPALHRAALEFPLLGWHNSPKVFRTRPWL